MAKGLYLRTKKQVEPFVISALYYSRSLVNAKRLVEAKLNKPFTNGAIQPVKHDEPEIMLANGCMTAKVRVYLGLNQDQATDIEVSIPSPNCCILPRR